jgi:hypothetical protein
LAPIGDYRRRRPYIGTEIIKQLFNSPIRDYVFRMSREGRTLFLWMSIITGAGPKEKGISILLKAS